METHRIGAQAFLFRSLRDRFWLALMLALAGGCSTLGSEKSASCLTGAVVFDSSFESARMDECEKRSTDHYRITLQPENTPINHSPWYAFRIVAGSERSITVELTYKEHKHRYHPKLSRDGESWQPLEPERFDVSADGTQVQMRVAVGPEPTWISAQEIFDNGDYDAWMLELASHPFAQVQLLGTSLEQRKIYKIDTFTQEQDKAVLLVGRQHPPEVTGALAMRTFVNRLFADDSLARTFREQFGMVIVPNLNPDGVDRGNWRHNVGGVDLNRDWGPFSQPETQLIRDDLLRFKASDTPRPYLFLDFHSTSKDVLYTQPPEMKTFPEGFTEGWLSAMTARTQRDFSGYRVLAQPGHNAALATSKNYMYATFGIPAITFELGDDTEREFIDQYAALAAEEMMTVLLASIE